MRSLAWWLAERRIRRALPAQTVEPVLGDLAEDFAAQAQRLSPIRASVWLLAESRSLAVEYQTQPTRRDAMMRLTTLTKILRDDARLALRRLRRQRAATIASILTLACAIAAGAVTWTLVSAVLLNPLPVAEGDRLFVVGSQAQRQGKLTDFYAPQLYPTFESVERMTSFDAVAGGGSWTPLVSIGAGLAEPRTVYFASHRFFDTLGVRMSAGRTFSADEDQRGAAPTAVLSHRFWNTFFKSDPGVIGTSITVGGQSTTIVGVASANFRGIDLAEAPDLYMPLRTVGIASTFMNFFADTNTGTSPSSWITIIGRLKPGHQVEAAAAELQAATGPSRASVIFSLVPLRVAAIPAAVRPKIVDFAKMLLGTVGLLLLIGGLTVGLLLLVRTETRRDEFAMCLALGATRRRLALGVAVEGVLLTAAGCALAMPLAWLLFRSLGAFRLPGNVEIGLLDLSMNGRVVATAAACAAAAALLIAAVAAAIPFTGDLSDALRSRAGATPRTSRRRMRSAMVVAQVAVTLVLLAGGGLFGRSLIASIRLNPGFETAKLIDVNLGLSTYGYTPERTTEFAGRLRTQLIATPGVTSVATYQSAGSMRGNLTIDGESRPVPSTVDYSAVDEHYFPTIGMRILRGRNFTADDRLDAPIAIIVSESFGRLIAGASDPVGHRVKEISGQRGKPMATATVVGVVPDVVTDVRALEPLAVYYAVGQRPPSPSRRMLVRVAASPASAQAAARAAIRSMDPAVNPGPMPTFADRISRQMAPQQFAALVLGVLGFIAVLLTVLGAYVLAESMASLRHRETGIRAALGASRGALTSMLAGQTMRLIGLGLVVGLGLTWAATSVVRGLLFQVEPLDPVTLITTSGLILVTSLGVSLRPALLAARADLTKLLKDS